MSRQIPEEASRRLAARARRIARVRRRILAATLATFVLAWGVIAATGPMGVTSSTTQATSGSASSGEATSSSTDSSASSSSSGDSLDLVTTSQS
jgi:hypothetical protein